METISVEFKGRILTALRYISLLLCLAVSANSALAQNLSGIKEIQTLEGDPITQLELGQSFRYRLTWQCSFVNTPPTDECGPFVLVDDLPDITEDGIPLEFVSCSPTTDYDCSVLADEVTITKKASSPGGVNLGDGQSSEAFISVRLSSDQADWPGGVLPTMPVTVSNEATITFNDGAPNSFGPMVASVNTVPPSNNWRISKTLVEPGISSPGPALEEDIRYRISLCPEGPAGIGTGTIPLTGVMVTDNCDAGAVLESATLNGVPIAGVMQPDPLACDAPIVMNIGDLAPTQCHDIDVTLRYPSPTFAVLDAIQNEATAISNEGPMAICDAPCSNVVNQNIAAPDPNVSISKGTVRGELGLGALSEYSLGLSLADANVSVSGVEIIDDFTTSDTPGTTPSFTVETFSDLSWSDNSVTADIFVINAGGGQTLVVVGYNGDPSTLPMAPPTPPTTIPFNFAADDEGFRIAFQSDLPPGFELTGPTMRYRVDSIGLAVGDIIENCVDITGTYTPPPGLGMPIAVNQSGCAQDTIVEPRADVSSSKSMPGALSPLDEFTASLTLSQSFTSTLGMSDTEIYDCLPPQVEFVNPAMPVVIGDIVYTGFTYTGPDPVIDVLPAGDPNNNCPINLAAMPATQGELLRVKWTGLTMPISNGGPIGINTSITVPVELRIVEYTEAQSGLENLGYIGAANDGAGPDDYACTALATGVYDETNLDGTNINLCQSQAGFVVLAAAAIGARKFVGGFPGLENIDPDNPPTNAMAGDPGITPPLCTMPGITDPDGRVRTPCVAQGVAGLPYNYRVRLSNEGNVPLTDYIAYDILPYTGDLGTTQLQAATPRGSVWTPLLLGPLVLSSANVDVQAELDKISTLPPGPDVPRLEYSASTNPCRDELATGADGPWQGGACDDDWVPQPLSDPITFPDGFGSVRAWRLVMPFATAGWPLATVADETLEDIVVDIQMLIPSDAPTSDYDLNNILPAFNNIAHRATAEGGGRLLAAEARKSGIVVSPAVVNSAGVRLGNLVWMDTNNDGFANVGEPGLFDVNVQLWEDIDATPGPSAGDRLYDVQQTDSVGKYLFDDDFHGPDNMPFTLDDLPRNGLGMPPGNYYVVIPNAQTGSFDIDKFFSSTGVGNDPNAQDNEDNDDNGASVTAMPIAATGGVIDGFFSGTVNLAIGGEPAGAAPLPETDRFGGAIDDDNDFFTDADSNVTVDFGFYQLRIGNLVWLDDGAGANTNNGIADTDESGINGLDVELWLDDGAMSVGVFDPTDDTRLMTDTTDAMGQYLFEGLDAGNYFVAIPNDPMLTLSAGGNTYGTDGLISSAPSVGDLIDDNEDDGTTPAVGDSAFGLYKAVSPLYMLVPNTGPSMEFDTSSNGITGMSSTDPLLANVELSINLINNSNLPDVNSFQTADFSFVPLVSLGSTVWEDSNANGLQDALEPAIQGARVRLFDSTGTIEIPVGIDGILGTADDAPGGVVTNVDGEYFFNDLLPGTYRVQVDVATEVNGNGIYYQPSPIQQANADNDNNDDSNVALNFPLDVLTDTLFWSDDIVLLHNTEPPSESDLIGTPGTDQPGQVLPLNDPDISGNMTLDIGLVLPVSLGSTVWEDTNANGVQDLGEPAIVGATVTLLDAFGAPVDSDPFMSGVQPVPPVMTDVFGQYNFNDLPPGTYQVQVDLATASTDVTNFVPSPIQTADPEVASNDDSNIDFSLAENTDGDTVYLSNVITLRRDEEPANEIDPILSVGPDQPNQNFPSVPLEDPDTSGNMTVDFGFHEPYNVGSVVFRDDNDSGTQDVGEVGIGGVLVQLFDGLMEVPAVGADGLLGTADDVLGGVSTLGDGSYNFSGLPPGDYTVRFTLPPGMQFAPSTTQVPDPDGTNQGINLDSNLIVVDRSLSVFNTDVFNLGTPAESEPSAETAPGGAAEVDPSATVDARGNLTVDAGFIPVMNLGNLVWEDVNLNNVFDAGVDLPIPGATVSLLIENPAAPGTFIPATDAFGAPVAQQTTLGDGMYNFVNLLPADYKVEVSAPTNFSPVAIQVPDPDGAGTMDTDNDSNLDLAATALIESFTSGIVTLSGGDEPLAEEGMGNDGDLGNLTVDFGFFQPLSLGTVVFEDGNNDGLVDATDGNGVQDPGEPGINGATVSLFRVDPMTPTNLIPVVVDSDGVYVIGQMGTNNSVLTSPLISGVALPDGSYNFSGLPADEYVVRVVPPAGYVPTATQVADPEPGINLDSNIDLAALLPVGTWQSGVIDLQIGDSPFDADEEDPLGVIEVDPSGTDQRADGNADLTIDFGFVQQVAIGNTVWLDDGAGGGVSDDGIINGAEAGVAGVVVELYAAGATAGSGAELASTITDSNGNYLFDHLMQGDYFVHIPAINFAVGRPLDGLRSSSPEGGDVGLDDDSDENGVNAGDAGGISSGDITLAIGGEPVAESGFVGLLVSAQPDNSTDSTVDFGFLPALLGSIGNYVWLDEDSDGEQGAGEAGLPNVVVQLKDSTGTVIATTTTDANGGYLFSDLPAADYFVDVDETALTTAGLSQTTVLTHVVDSAGDADLVNDDGDFGNKDHSADGYAITLDEGEHNQTADFGYNWNPSDDVNNNVNNAALGDRVWIDSNGNGVQDANEIPVEGAELSLFVDPDGDGVFDTPFAANPTQLTDANGNYLFDDLPAGAYVVEVTASAGSHDVLDTGAYTQTGDPDHFAADTSTAQPGEAGDNGSTSPIVLSNGDVFLNVDFGYQPVAGVAPVGSIGDTIWFDLDADGSGPNIPSIDGQLNPTIAQGNNLQDDSGEPTIAGVTVALAIDTNGDGVFDPDGLDNAFGTLDDEPLVANDITDENGQYLFDGLAFGDYVVVVTDTENVLEGLVQTFDSNGVFASPNESGVSIAAGGPGPINRSQDFGYVPDDPMNPNDGPLGSIGDTVWGDLDGLGGDQTTQANEPGLAGVLVNLYVDEDAIAGPDDTNGDGVVTSADAISTTSTDANGNYLFTGLPFTTYIVGVDDSTLPSAYLPTATYLPVAAGVEDDVLTGNDLGDPVTLTALAAHDRAQDFSYPIIPGAPGSGLIGDTVWGDLDTDGNGPAGAGDGSDPTEPLFAGVTVRLFDTSSMLVATQVTDSQGTYLFTGLDPTAIYNVVVDTTTLPNGYQTTPTGDPEGDNDSVSLVNLGEAGTDGVNDPDATDNGQNLGQDFGYPLVGATPIVGSVGDTIWFDVDSSSGDQVSQGAEPGLAGVSVTLTPPASIDAGAGAGVSVTTVTNANGEYLFTNLPLNETYIVSLDTTSLPTYVGTLSTHDGTDAGSDSLSTATPTVVVPDVRDQDFSYPPQLTPASIGDTIFIDNGDSAGAQDANDTPIEGVLVNLLDAGGVVIATTLTDLNGGYLFTGLDPNETYSVEVDADNFIAGGTLAGMLNTVDPDGTTDSVSQVVLPAGDGNADEDGPNNVNLGQDFGYIASTSVNIGNLVWLDKDADGIFEANGLDGVPGTEDDETPIGGVTVNIYRDLDGNGQIDPGEPLFGQTVTDAAIDDTSFLTNGNYLFADLPADNYVVTVTDDDGVLTGYWQSIGAAMTDDNSQLPSYAVDATVADNLTADFGYYVEPGSIGDVVWEDLNGNGLYDPATEPGVDGVTVVLTITNIDGGTTTLTTETELGGRYRFDNLLLDEDFNGIATVSYGNAGDEPAHFVTLDQTTTPDYLSPIYDSNANPMNTDSVIVGGDLADQDDADVGGDDGILGEPAFPPMGSIDSTNDFGFALPAAIGNYVWLDLDMDGTQDANESGIPNVTVNLLDATNAVLSTTVTGPNGEYLFPGLLPGSPFTVQVDDTTLPPGLIQTFDEGDGLGATDHLSAPITLLPDEEHLTADFGYAVPPGSIGDTVWIDANDNGIQDPGEPGLAGFEVTLTPPPDVDPDGAGIATEGTPLTVLTDANGMYLFTGLPLNETYIVTVTNNGPPLYAPSASGLGDPDVRDGNSLPGEADESTFVVLSTDNTENLDADFGYLPDPTVSNNIGGTIWSDLDEDGNGPAGAGDGSDTTETPFAGVTVTLFDGAGVPIASVMTGADGTYLFTGIPDGNYTVRVTDQNNVLGGLQQTADADDLAAPGSFVATTPNESAVIGLALGATVLGQSFGYVAPNNTANTGVIGDTIFFDQNNSGTGDPGEGVEGVTVQLFGPGPDGDITTVADNVLVASTVTNENGGYTFTGLDTSDTGPNPGTDYQVVVVDNSLPNGGVGWSNSVDPDTVPGPGDNTSITTLTDALPSDLAQDFGYTSLAMNTISGTVWPDTNGDGMQTEVGVLGGVTIELLDGSGNLIQTTETDAAGNYQFVNLPDGMYRVVVTDENNVLSGFEHTDSPNGSSDTADQTSKDDTGYVVDLDSAGLINSPVFDASGDFGYSPTVTNPISLGSFVANSVAEGRVRIEWKTQTEVANLGFNIYGQVNGGWVQLNDSLIPGQGDSVTVQSYSAEFQTTAKLFAIGDIDLTGAENMHGAYRLGEPYGAIGQRRSIDWEAEKTERAIKRAERKKQREAQQRERNQRRQLRRQSTDTSAIQQHEEPTMANTKSLITHLFASLVAGVISSAHAQPVAEDIVNLKTTVAGIHQLSHQDLLNYGVDLGGVAVVEIALMNLGQSVPTQVTGSHTEPTLFGPGSVIRFIANTVDTLYSDTNVYTLRLDASAALPMSAETNSVPVGESANAYLATRRYAPQAKYSFVSPNKNDPWYAKRILAIGEPEQEVVQIKLDNVAVGGNTGSTKAKLKVNVWGSTNLPGAGDDHHVTVSLNGSTVLDDTFDGLQAKQMETSVEAVREGNNLVLLKLPMDTGHAYDSVNINEVQISYPRKFVAESDRLDFASTFKKFLIEGFTSAALPNGAADLVVMRQDDNGTALIEGVKVACRKSCVVQLGGTGKLAQYFVAAKDALHRPVLDALPLEQEINAGQAAYLIISHPDFIGSAGDNQLEALAAQLTSEYGSADVVDVEAIYAQYGYHLFGPTAIQDYIRFAVNHRGTQTVLLVGGDVYDYRRFETEDAESFIPSIYAATGNNITFAPVDAKYVDLDDDNVPDLPIGRLPVRTVSQLSSLLSKREAYTGRSYNGKALLVADQYDNAQQYDFRSDANEIEADYLADWDVSKAYVDDLGVEQARSDVISGINQGQTLTAFFGHSSTNQWSFSGLFNGPDAAGLSNQGKPTVVTQWGCWNAYYVSPKEDSMGHRFMMEGDQGAVAVMGASTLTTADSERRLARMVFARLANGERLGEAVTNAKQDYAQQHPDDLDVLLGWTLLGLPELKVN